MRRRVLVLDGEQRAALAVVRSLGSAGCEILVGSASGRSLAGASRHCRTELRLPDPLLEPRALAAAVGSSVRDEGIDTLLPISEASLLALLDERDSFAGVLLPYPSAEIFRAVCDKERVLRLAREVGIAVPEQHVLHAYGSTDVKRSSLRFPLVVKPSRSVADNGRGRVKFGVLHARDADELQGLLASLDTAAFPVLLQERVVGAGVGIFVLVWEGRLVAAFSHRRLREKPPGGGVSVYRESIALDPALLARSRALLDRLNWSGVAMVEYKLDAATGRPFLMEINGRFWGSLQLAIDAGVDFPRLLLEAAGGLNPDPVLHYRTGVRSRWWWGDVDHLLARLVRSPDTLGLPPSAPSRLRAVADFLTLWRPGDRSEVLRLRDPRPFLRESIQWLAALRRGVSPDRPERVSTDEGSHA